MSLRLEIRGHGPSALALKSMLMRFGWQGPISLEESASQNLTEPGRRLKRSLALSAGSLQLIKACTGSLPAGADIRHVEVQVGTGISGGRSPLAPCPIGTGLVMSHEDLGLERLGSVVTWDDLVAHLHAKPDQHAPAMREQSAAINAHAMWSIRVWADGDPGDDAIEVDAGQSAIVGRLQVQGAPSAWALERFLPDGPLALLPDAQPQSMQLVWCASHALAELRFQALRQPRSHHGVERLLRELNMALPAGVRALAFGEPLQCIRLKRRARANMVYVDAGRREAEIWIGNAAQTLHPVAGQGMNLAMRDAAELARCMVEVQARLTSVQTGSSSVLVHALQRFERQRQRDRWLMLQITDQLAGQSTRLWFQLLAPHALALARHRLLKRLIARLFALGLRDPWPILG